MKTESKLQGCQLWLVRHGQTDWNIQGRYQGQSDIPLNAVGQAQAADLAAQLAGQTFTAIYSSDLQRASCTAQAVGDAVNLPVRLDDRLREIDQGEWEGMDYRDIVRQYAGLMEQRAQAAESFRAPGGESIPEVVQRVASAADEIACAHPGGRVLVVSHGVALAALICRAGGISINEIYSHIPHNAQPVVVQWPGD